MNKLWFGILTVLVIMCSVFVTAKIVQYISNKAIVNVEVESPIQIEIEDGTFDVHGGESFVIDMTITNNANMILSGNMTTTIHNDDGVTCDDFTTITVTKTINDFDNSTYNPICNNIDNENVEILLYNKPFAWGILEVDKLLINTTMDIGAVGSYVLETQILL